MTEQELKTQAIAMLEMKLHNLNTLKTALSGRHNNIVGRMEQMDELKERLPNNQIIIEEQKRIETIFNDSFDYLVKLNSKIESLKLKIREVKKNG